MASFDLSKTSGELSFDAVGSTKRMCADMATEDAILQALGAVKGFALEGEMLKLIDGEGKELMELKKKP
jgi:heat shock protein HslJ